MTPSRGGNGLAMRAGLFLEGLARGHSVRVLVVPVFGWAEAAAEFVRDHAAAFQILTLQEAADPLEEFTARLATPGGRRRTEGLHPMPSLCRFATPAAAEAVAAAADGCDSIHVMRLYLAPFLDVVLDRPSRPLLSLDVDDLESQTQRSLGRAEEADRFERLEAHYLPLFDRVITCARGDAEAIASRHGLSGVASVSNAVRPPEAPLGPAARGHDLVFVGNLSYEPNVEAARWLCREVLPLLVGVTVALVGSRPPPEVLALADERVTVAGDVPDVAPWYAGARVAAVPLHAGGGTHTKVLEALAHGRPVVATSRGVEGLEIDSGVLVVDSPEDFAAACELLLGDSDLAARVASQGQQCVRTSARVETVAAEIERLFRNILAT